MDKAGVCSSGRKELGLWHTFSVLSMSWPEEIKTGDTLFRRAAETPAAFGEDTLGSFDWGARGACCLRSRPGGSWGCLGREGSHANMHEPCYNCIECHRWELGRKGHRNRGHGIKLATAGGTETDLRKWRYMLTLQKTVQMQGFLRFSGFCFLKGT